MFFFLFLFLFEIGVAFAETPTAVKPTVVLISFDGFRWDYPEKAETPILHALMKSGVTAKSLIPVFPSITFPNHYSIITGLYPEHHGIVGNEMWDPEKKIRFEIHQ